MDKRPKILIVDDEPFNVDYLEQELEELDYDTVSAFNGREALAQVEAESPDVILLDIMMPEMDGFQVLERLKGDKAFRDIPVIVISAMSDLGSVVKGIKLGAEDYLPKPFDEVLLKARIEASLEKKRLRDIEQLYLQGLERELEIGRQIQAGFLPDELPQPSGWEIAAYFEAAREVAGDFYDVFTPTHETRLAIIVGDVCDKGVGSALFMALFRSLLRAMANLNHATGQIDLSPVGAIAQPQGLAGSAARLKNAVVQTNNYVAHTHSRAGRFTTLFFGLLDPASGELVYINGGHEPPLILGPAGVIGRLETTGPVVGIFPDLDFAVGEARLEPGQTLLIYTDGVTDAQNPDSAFFSQDRLLSLAAQPTSSATALLERIEASLRDHIAGARQFDDITMLAARRVAV